MPKTRLFRSEDWWVGKTSLLLGLTYLFAIYFSISFHRFWFVALLSIITIIGFASLGYLINDFFDLEKDKLAGKKNFLSGKTPIQTIIYCSISIFLLLFPWHYLPDDRISLTLISLQIIFYILYSAPGLRLKEMGILGLILDALYAHAIPAILAAYTYLLVASQSLNLVVFALLFVWQFFVGIRNVLLHQQNDAKNDELSGTSTFVKNNKSPHISRYILLLKVLEVVFFIAVLLMLTMTNRFFLLSVFSSALALIAYLRMNKTSGYYYYFPNLVYEQWLPYSLIIILSISDIRFLILFPIHSFLFSQSFIIALYKKVPFRNYFRSVAANSKLVLDKVRLLANWIVYLVFRLFGVNLIEKRTSAWGYISKKINNPNKGVWHNRTGRS